MSAASNGGEMPEKPDVGTTTYSFQHRCTRWSKHEPPHNEPYPCEGCYTLAQFNVVVPYRPHERFTRV